MAQLTESLLVERLRALREPLPDDGFSARLRGRLEREAGSRKVVPIRPLRTGRNRVVLLIAAAIPLAALAAAAASGWAPFTSASEPPRQIERKVMERVAPAMRPSSSVKPPAPPAVESAPVAPSAPRAQPVLVSPQRAPRPATPSAPTPTEPVVPSVVQDTAPEPSSSAAPAPVERMKIETRGAPETVKHGTERRELRRQGDEQDRAGAGERRRQETETAEERRRRRENADRERREQRRNRAGGGQGR